MNNKSCEFCGVIIESGTKFCESCAQMMGVENPKVVSQITEATTQANPILPPANLAVQTPVNPSPIANQNFNRANQTTTIGYGSNYQSGYAKPLNNPLPALSPIRPAENSYKPGLLDWFWDLSLFVKVGAGVFIGAIVFAVVLKVFMQLDVSTTVQTPTTPIANLEPQKTWFSGWFRSNPTVEEIFEKYEKTTRSKGQKPTAQNYYLSGTFHLLKALPNGSVDVTTLYKEKGVAGQSKASLSYYDSSFELYLKYPNSTLLRAVTDPKILPNQSMISPLVTGFNGIKNWGMAKVTYQGETSAQESQSPTPVFYYNIANGGISLAFQHSAYSKAEMVNEEIVFNRRSYNIKATDIVGKETFLCFDVETGLLTKITQTSLIMAVVDHKEFDGIMYPSKLVYKVNDQWVLLSIDNVQTNASIDDKIFQQSFHYDQIYPLNVTKN